MTNELDVTKLITDVRLKGDNSASKYLEAEHKDFSIYSITSRAIPLINGLKPVQQRCLWSLRGVSKYEKVAKLTGMVMSIHPHGDCLDFDTEVLLADGNHIKIGEWVENNPKTEMLITAYDREKAEYVTTSAIPTNGKIVDELIEIEFENGAIIRSSIDHKFLLDDGQTYVTAEELTDKMSIKSDSIDNKMRIKSVKRIKMDKPTQLYDISVNDYSNLVVKVKDKQVVVHNSSISEAINQMAGPYCNNVPWLDGHGAFGTRINPTAFGSPRYVSSKFSTFAKEVIFKDWEIVPLKPTYDETDVEPKMLLPLIPLVLLNGVQGIATGYSTVVLPRSLKDLVDRQIKVLRGHKIDNPLPYSKPIDNVAIRDETNPNKYTFLGECVVVDTATAKITKLPYGMTHVKVIESLAKMVDKGLIVNYVDKSKADVHIVVTFKRAALKNKSNEFVARKLKLSAGATERIIVLDAKTSSAVHEYHDAAKFIEDYTNWRLSFFPARYERLIELNLADISRLNDVVLSIDNDLGGQAKKIKNKADLVVFIEKIGVNDIDYISSLPVYRFTEEEYEKATSKIADLEEQNREYKSIIDDVEKQKSIYTAELQEVRRKFGK